MTPLRSNPIVHLELHTGDLPQARVLYAELCGWRPQWIQTRAGPYLSFELGDGVGGGIPAGWRSVVATPVGGEIAFWQPKARRRPVPGTA